MSWRIRSRSKQRTFVWSFPRVFLALSAKRPLSADFTRIADENVIHSSIALIISSVIRRPGDRLSFACGASMSYRGSISQLDDRIQSGNKLDCRGWRYKIPGYANIRACCLVETTSSTGFFLVLQKNMYRHLLDNLLNKNQKVWNPWEGVLESLL